MKKKTFSNNLISFFNETLNEERTENQSELCVLWEFHDLSNVVFAFSSAKSFLGRIRG